MFSSLNEVADYIERGHYRGEEFDRLLGNHSGEAMVYYLAPLANIKKMLAAGCILPRSRANGFFDVSMIEAQALRNKSVLLQNGSNKVKVPLHDCVNIFFNPINTTLLMFRKNALLRSSRVDPDELVIGIIAIPLREINQGEVVYWHISNKNNAKVTTPDGSISPANVDWKAVYNLKTSPKSQGYSEGFAELLIWQASTNGARIKIPANSSVSMLDTDLRFHKPDWHRKINIIQTQEDLFPLSDPLNSDAKFYNNFFKLFSSDVLVIQVAEVFRKIQMIQRKLSKNIMDHFPTKDAAHSTEHGASHTLRVMLWVNLLSILERSAGRDISKIDQSSAVCAAFFHDLGRSDNLPGSGHGESAVAAHEEEIEKLGKFAGRTGIARIKRAINDHGKDDNKEAGMDIILKLLKDADALDRGRFSRGIPYFTDPSSADYPDSHGCNLDYLRLEIFKDKRLATEIGWLAYFLAKIAKTLSNYDDPAANFIGTILKSLRLARQYCEVEPQHAVLCDHLICEIETHH